MKSATRARMRTRLAATRARMRTPLAAALALLVGVAVAGPAVAQGDGGANAASLEVRVWQNVDDDRDLYVSARLAGGSWRALGTVPLALDGLTASGGYRYGDVALAVPQGDGEADVDVRVWQDDSLLQGIFVSVRFAGGSWSVPGTATLPLDDGFTSNGRYRYGDVSLAVPPEEATAREPTASRSEIVLPSVTIEFEGDFLGAERALTQELERHFNDAAAFFIQRYGLAVPGLTILKQHAVQGYGAAYANKTIFVTKNSVQRPVIAHEYVHALQEYLSGGSSSPAWMVEGMAVYFGDKFETLHEERILSLLHGARHSQKSLRGMEIRRGGINYATSSLAVHRLASLAGEEALFNFYSSLNSSPSWQESFKGAFGMTVDAFYEDFSSYRAAHAPSLPQIHGVVLDPGGNPAPGLLVSAFRLGTYGGPATETDASGRFSVGIRSGRHILNVHHLGCGGLGFLDDNGSFTRSREEARIIEVGDSNVTGIAVNLPADPAQPCVRSGSGWWEWWVPPVNVEEPELMSGVRVAFFAGLPGSAPAGIPRFADGPGGAALFNRPAGMALTASGDVIVADSWNHAIRRIAPDGMVTTVAGGNGKGVRDGQGEHAQFAEPRDVAVHADGSIYVADSQSGRIRRIGTDGVVTTVAGGGSIGRENAEFRDGPAAEARFLEPFAIAFTPDGNLLIVDRSDSRIRALSPAGRVSTLKDEVGGHEIRPIGIAIDDGGTVFFTGALTAIREIDGRGNVSTVLQAIPDRWLPGSIAVGPDGALYVVALPWHISDTSDDPQLFRVARDGSTLSAIDVDGTYELAGIVRTDDGALLVSDARNNAIWKITIDAE